MDTCLQAPTGRSGQFDLKHTKELALTEPIKRIIAGYKGFDDICMQHMYDKTADSVQAITAVPSIC